MTGEIRDANIEPEPAILHARVGDRDGRGVLLQLPHSRSCSRGKLLVSRGNAKIVAVLAEDAEHVRVTANKCVRGKGLTRLAEHGRDPDGTFRRRHVTGLTALF